jgi:DNA-binding transcriptional MerR regulator
MGADESRAPRDQNSRHLLSPMMTQIQRRLAPPTAEFGGRFKKAFPSVKRCYTLNLGLRSRRIFMRIGELSRRTGISTSRIRFYERHDVLPKPIRDENGYRTYPDTAVKILELIDGAQRLGFSLSEIRAGLSEAAPNLPSHAAMVKALRRKLDHIDQHIKEVRARRRQIVKLLKEKFD